MSNCDASREEPSTITGEKPDPANDIYNRVCDALMFVDSPKFDVDLVFSKIETILRKRFHLSFAQCDELLAGLRIEIEEMIDTALDGAFSRDGIDAIVEEFEGEGAL
jgi:hypothetical protein